MPFGNPPHLITPHKKIKLTKKQTNKKQQFVNKKHELNNKEEAIYLAMQLFQI